MPLRALSTTPRYPVLPEQGAVFCLTSDQIDLYWSRFAHHLERFCGETSTEYALDELQDDLRAARKQFWGFDDGEHISMVCLTEIRRSVCWLCVCCGDETFARQIERGLEAIAAWAADTGCKTLKIRGRLGWERRLKGFRRTAVILEKELCSPTTIS